MRIELSDQEREWIAGALRMSAALDSTFGPYATRPDDPIKRQWWREEIHQLAERIETAKEG